MKQLINENNIRIDELTKLKDHFCDCELCKKAKDIVNKRIDIYTQRNKRLKS